MNETISKTEQIIAKELAVKPSQVQAAIQLLDDGATVPFIARYRKEATEGLDDTQLRQLVDRLQYLRDLDERRATILKTIQEQGALTEALEQAINSADTKTRLEDLYLPYRPKRRTKALIAREAGLEPLALALWQNPTLAPEDEAAKFINQELGIDTLEAALEGAQQILMQQFAENAGLIDELREHFWQQGVLSSTRSRSKKVKEPERFQRYFEYKEPIKKIPSHRALALFRGRREQVLQLALAIPDYSDYAETRIATFFNITNQDRPADAWLLKTVQLTWQTKLLPKLELELFNRLREIADDEAIRVFASNLHDLLLAAPAGPKVTMGLDPGIRTGVKVAIVDSTGKLLDYSAVFPFAPQNAWHDAITSLAKLIIKHEVTLISIGNGTASRETDRLVTELLKTYPDIKVKKAIVNEAGASVYSASELAANEFPDLDVSFRGAVSIARRLQDPLAELVKIEPKSIGVGQYQHDVNPLRLAQGLHGVVEDCVNTVGVDVNTASTSLLSYVAGFSDTLAKNLVQHRDEHGAFHSREELKLVARMGEKTFQQSAGFLRVANGDNALDATAVHPESYPLVERILADQNMALNEALGHSDKLQGIRAENYVNDQFGLPTIHDVLQELKKPGRDPRPEFKTARFKEGVDDIRHLEVGMMLEGVVGNVTDFGAFVDVGVHKDGLVPIAAMANYFVKDPRSVVKPGDIVTVKVTEIDEARRRIGLSMKLDEDSTAPSKKKTSRKQASSQSHSSKKQATSKAPSRAKKIQTKKPTLLNTTMADALSKLKGDLK